MATAATDRPLSVQFNPHLHYTGGVTLSTSVVKSTLTHPRTTLSDQPIYPDLSAHSQPHPHMADPPYQATYGDRSTPHRHPRLPLRGEEGAPFRRLVFFNATPGCPTTS